MACAAQDEISSGRLPIDVTGFPELRPAEILALHAAHGVSAPSLTALLGRLNSEGGGSALRPAVEVCSSFMNTNELPALQHCQRSGPAPVVPVVPVVVVGGR